jgi:hypothetical protein
MSAVTDGTGNNNGLAPNLGGGNVQAGDAWTICGWVKPTADPSGGAPYNSQQIAALGNGNNGASILGLYRSTISAAIKMQTNSGSGTGTGSNAGSLPINTWTPFAITSDGGTGGVGCSVKAYYGTGMTLDSTTSLDYSLAGYDGFQLFVFGPNGNAAYPGIVGKFDGMKFWKGRAVSQSQLVTEVSCRVIQSTTNQFAQIKCQGNGNDSSGLGHDFDLGGMTFDGADNAPISDNPPASGTWRGFFGAA